MSLTTSQKTAIAAAIAADPVIAAFAAVGDDPPIAEWLNTEDTTKWVWKNSFPPSEYDPCLAGNVFDDLPQDRFNQWSYWTGGGTKTLDPSRPNIRAAILNTFGGAATSVQASKDALIAAAKRHPSRIEVLLAEGDGTEADPAVLTFVGPIDLATTSQIRAGDF